MKSTGVVFLGRDVVLGKHLLGVFIGHDLMETNVALPSAFLVASLAQSRVENSARQLLVSFLAHSHVLTCDKHKTTTSFSTLGWFTFYQVRSELTRFTAELHE